ncbi:probable WRKY transcription factor 51 [Olea europaea var. sylvestris]|uniref:probable WRKY transcription factor 51 n=1 Tax=Olea europaea var. sylvestris TaxID=158386 RepID=UPI000C1D3687|nr:probable WRKY transcription factor 51 [Olea europaea var. sylvestris]
MSAFNSAKNNTSQYQNPDPNYHQVADSTTTDQLDELFDFKFSDYFAFDGALEEEISTQANVESSFNGSSSSSTPLASNIRKVKKYKTNDAFRFAFRTKSTLEIMDDGFKWRKYGKKMVKNNPNPRYVNPSIL